MVIKAFMRECLTGMNSKFEQLVKVIRCKASSPPHTDSSIVFAWLICGPHLVHYIPIGIRTVPVLSPAESLWIYQLLVMSGHGLARPHFALKLVPSRVGNWTPI